MVARVVAVVVMLIVLAPIQAYAQDQADETRFGFAPIAAENPDVTAKGYFVYHMEPGSSATGQVLLRNTGTQPVTIALAAVDALTAQTGGSAFATEASPNGVAQWIALDESRITLQPEQEQAVGFSVHAPDSVQPGQYLAGLAASTVDSASKDVQTESSQQMGATIHLQKRYVIAVQPEIVGTWTSEVLIDHVDVLAQPTGTYIGVQMRNNGTAFIKPSGSLTLTNAEGKQILSQPIDMGTFVTGTTITYPILWPEAPKAGQYDVAVNLKYGDGQTVTYNDVIEISAQEEARAAEVQARTPSDPVQTTSLPSSAVQPWMLYSLGALLLLMIIVLTLNLRRISRSHKL